MKTLIVGGVAGGASAAARLRRLDEKSEIILFEKGPHISFANCGLPYYLGGVIAEEQALLLQTPASFFGRFCVDVRVNSEVLRIDRAEKRVEVLNGETGQRYWESYEKLILSPGAVPATPPITGLDQAGVFTLRNVPDTLEIDEYIRENKISRAVVIGGGNIGVELAENLCHRGIAVTIVEFAPHVITALDTEMANLVQKELREHGVTLRLGCGVTAVEKVPGGLHLKLTQGEMDTQMVLLCAGVVPNSKLAKDAGLELGVRGCIAVNDKMQTSDPDIYAVGDAVEVTEFVTGQKRHIALAGPANRQGRIAADQIAGIDSRYKNTQGSSITKVFDLAVACTGITESTAKACGMDVDKIYLSSGAHAGYYPGAKPLTAKILFERTTGKILGGQFIGAEGADKRCDVLAVAIRAGMDAQQLTELELCYAPPYSSAKDPINMAGFAIENVVTGKVKNFHWENVPSLNREDVTLLDVRTAEEYAKGSVPGFINIPLHELRYHLGEIPMDKPVYVHCHSGLRSYVASRILVGSGYDCYNLSGGYVMYQAVNG